MKNKITFIGFLFWRFFLPAEESKNLADCIETAIKNNPGFAQTRLLLEEALQRENQARTLEYPYAVFSANSIVTSEENQALMDMGQAGEKKMKMGEKERADMALTLSHLLYSGNKIKNGIRSKEAIKESVDCKIEAEKNVLRFDVIKTYYQLAKFLNLKKVNEALKKQIELHKKDAENQVSQGMLLKNEILMIDIRVMDAEQAILTAENGISKMQMLLSEQMGVSLEEKVIPVVNWDVLPPFPVPQRFENSSLNRPEIRMMEKQAKASEWFMEMKKSETKPSVSTYVSGHYGWPGFTTNDPEWAPYWQAGINVSLDVFDRGKTKSEISEARTAWERSQKALEEVSKKIKLDVSTTRFNYGESMKKFQIAKDKKSTAEENLRITTENFRSGLASNSAYLDSQLELMKADNERATLGAELWIAWADYLRALGMSEMFSEKMEK